ncbi:unnamed protein product [Menidia menidia]|uniref:(Atlantic silverside) hypothetical protein n=1 Tax=Menidia menidia TaxID=238744 RepID=A0A8S4B0N7_9TELE|nr:unnamed protein product [Menidia menidia]
MNLHSLDYKTSPEISEDPHFNFTGRAANSDRSFDQRPFYLFILGRNFNTEEFPVLFVGQSGRGEAGQVEGEDLKESDNRAEHKRTRGAAASSGLSELWRRALSRRFPAELRDIFPP